MISIFEKSSQPAIPVITEAVIAPPRPAPPPRPATIEQALEGLRREEIAGEQCLRSARTDVDSRERELAEVKEALITGTVERSALRSAQDALAAARQTIETIAEDLATTRELLKHGRAVYEKYATEAKIELSRDLGGRYNAARRSLGEALVAAAIINAQVEAMEAEAEREFPRGTRPEAPSCFFQNSVSFRSLSMESGGRIVAWLEDLLRDEPAAFPEIGHNVMDRIRGERARQEAEAERRTIQSGKELRAKIASEEEDFLCLVMGMDRKTGRLKDSRFDEHGHLKES